VWFEAAEQVRGDRHPVRLLSPNPVTNGGAMVYNERVKLLATTLNNLGLAFAIGGFVAPLMSGRLLGWSAVVPAAWFCLAGALHLSAQIVLGRIRP
jgi:hypothetical protein